MTFLPTVSSFFFLLCFSIVFCLSSRHWFGVWLGLELNIISFIVLIINAKRLNSRESSIKYFLLQALGRGLFLFGFMLSYIRAGFWGLCLGRELRSIFILVGLGIKLGASPFHFWVPRVINSLSWGNALILSTFQKVAPLLFLLYLSSFKITIPLVVLGVSRALVGGLGGLNQTQLRSLIGYSSINHIGWIIRVSLVSLYFSVFYLFVYLLNVVLIFWFISKIDINKFFSVSLATKDGQIKKSIFYLCLLSLGGLPPLLGFFPKIMALSLIIDQDLILVCLLVILGSVLSLSYYLNLFFIRCITGFSAFKQTDIFIFYKTDLYIILVLTVLVLMGLISIEILFI